ncbi:MAG: hypothetical protein RLZZ417_1283 [Bacteroidota bacterium]
MNTIVTNRFILCHDELKRLRKVRSSRQFALSLDYLPQSLSEILKGRRDVTLELLRKGVEKYAMNPVYLLTGKGSFFSELDSYQSEKKADTDLSSSVIYLVPHLLGKKYASERRNDLFLSSLENIKLPGINSLGIKLRAFEIQSEKWYPSFLPGDILISEKIDPTNGVKTISNDKVYVIVTKNGVRVNKIDLHSITKGVLTLYFENKKEKSFELKLSEMLELWEVKLKITRNVENENITLNSLLSEIKDIRQLLYSSANTLV